MAIERQAQYLVAAAVSLAATLAGMSLAWSTPVIPKFHNNETGINITDETSQRTLVIVILCTVVCTYIWHTNAEGYFTAVHRGLLGDLPRSLAWVCGSISMHLFYMEEQISWVASLSSPGFMTGSLVTRFISDGFGRRAVLLSSALPVVIGTIIVMSTATAWWIYLTRILWGIGTGMIITVSAIYLAEVSDKEIRGKVTSSIRYMQFFGGFLIMSVGPFVSYHAISYMLLVLPICYFIGCCFIPESPYYLLKEGKVNEARASLIKLSRNKDEKVIESRLSAMWLDVKNETLRSGSVKELFTGKQYRKALVICIGLKFTQIMSGSIVILQYVGRIVQESETNVDVSTVLIIFGAVKFISGIFSSAIVDKVGRRPLLVFSYLSSGLTLIPVGAYFFIKPTSSPYYSYIPIIGIILTSILSIIGYDSLVYLIIAEIFPLNVKSVAMTSQNILGGFLNFLSVKGYQEIKDVAGLAGVFWFYASSSIIGAIFSYFLVPETKGKSLREIQIELQGALYGKGDVEKMYNVIVNEDAEATELNELKRDYTTNIGTTEEAIK